MCGKIEGVNFTAQIKQEGRRLGFDLVGIVPAAPLEQEGARLRAWLENGFAGTMEWIDRSVPKRVDPSAHLPGVRSVVCVAMNYFTTGEAEEKTGRQGESDGLRGKISRYAWGDDYHRVLGDRLRLLLDWICAKEPGCLGRIAVDSSPVMDRAWAVRAGLGWIGKHSNLIHPAFGSWIFLGELLLTLQLDYDETPVADHCGSCTLCIDSCPTSAIVQPYVVDSRKCISYQTIEFRGEDLQVNTDGWIYGCDICQEVCPWNSLPKESRQAAFRPRPGLLDLSLQEVLEMSEEEFRKISRGSAIARTKYRGMVRNARHVVESQPECRDERPDGSRAGSRSVASH
ncbi:MAG: tRNA epoxyqueuosine(34) reductase QueG [Acidobacteria bacterium]|nr:tRNA epoxyqueuosine(34) reductase QueG [Acidobacteriota bacterium]